MSEMEELAKVVSSSEQDRLGQVTVEIITIQRQTERIVLTSAIEIGRRLTEVKSLLPHGEWGNYIREKLDYSQSTANNFMRVYEEYGQQQDSLFGGTDLQALGDLSYTKVLRLLALPAEERMEFVEENDVESMSTRELEKALKNLETEKKAAEDAAERALLAFEQEKQGLEEKVKQAQVTVQMAQNREDAVRQARDELSRQVAELEAKVKKAREAEKTAKAALKQAQEHPEIPESTMEELRQQVAADAAAKATEDLQKQLSQAKADAQAAESQLQDAKNQVAAAEKKVQMANPDMALVGAYLKGVQEQFNKLCEALSRVAASDPVTAAKLKENVKSKVIEGMAKALEAV